MITKWDNRFLGLAKHIAAWSKDPSTKVGAVIADRHNRIISLGYNGLPRKIEDNPSRLQDRETKLALTLHAEQNAILFAQGRAWGSTIYTWPLPPCAHCASQIVQAGLYRVVSPAPTPEHILRWGESLRLAAYVMREAGVVVEESDDDTGEDIATSPLVEEMSCEDLLAVIDMEIKSNGYDV
jgi:dCMP deaminase